jgi:hypothetical protein
MTQSSRCVALSAFMVMHPDRVRRMSGPNRHSVPEVDLCRASIVGASYRMAKFR